MKKSVLIAILGVAATAATSYGQGYITFSSYNQPGSNTINQFIGGALVDSPYVAQLYYAVGTVADPVSPNAGSITAVPAGLTLYTGASAGGPYPTPISGGYFTGGGLTIPGYSGGAITFEVIAYNGASYATSASRGRSGAFTMTTGIRTDTIYSNWGDGGQAVMPAFVVAAVPEPTTLALAGLGGLAALVAYRRKQA